LLLPALHYLVLTINPLAYDNKALAFSYWGIGLLVSIFFLTSWLRDPGYVRLRPNPQFQVLLLEY